MEIRFEMLEAVGFQHWKAYLIRHVKWPMSDFCARES